VPVSDSSRDLSLKEALRREAQAAGFVTARVAAADAIPQAADRLQAFVAAGLHGDMHWMAETQARRGSPKALWPEVRSVVMLGMSYAPASDPLSVLGQPHRAAISCYAQGKDYHDVVKSALKRVARWLVAETGAEVKVFVDTAPVMEKPLAEASGLGWQGKHTNLVSREHGSWLFLGAIYTTLLLEPDEAEADHCGSCNRCLAACPTNAFPAPYRLDPRRCISYLTIEHKGHIAVEFRKPMGNRIYGCDDCLAVCPWNKFAKTASEQRFAARSAADNPALAELLVLDDAGFRARFAGTPIKRTGRDRFVRNVLIAAGNSGDASLLPHVERLLADASPLVRAMAVWALGRLAVADRVARLAQQHRDGEVDAAVRAEWEASTRDH
jgi:epoxyqueuosine reductase